MCKIFVIKCSWHARGNKNRTLCTIVLRISRFNPLRRCRVDVRARVLVWLQVERVFLGSSLGVYSAWYSLFYLILRQIYSETLPCDFLLGISFPKSRVTGSTDFWGASKDREEETGRREDALPKFVPSAVNDVWEARCLSIEVKLSVVNSPHLNRPRTSTLILTRPV